MLFAVAIGGMPLVGCSDEKSCSDHDRPSYADGNGSTVYDTGAGQDSFDYGGDTDVSRSGDSIGNGDVCRDHD